MTSPRRPLVLVPGLIVALTGPACIDPPGVIAIEPPAEEADVAPTLSELRVSPEEAGVGDRLELRFFTDQALVAERFVVTVDGKPATLSQEQVGVAYTFVYDVTGTEAEGDVPIHIVGENLYTLQGVLDGTVRLDFTAPTAGDILPSEPHTDTHVPGSFALTATFDDTAGVGVVGCEVCNAPFLPTAEGEAPPDNVCDGQWRPATFFGGECTATGLTCSDGAVLALNLRATDAVGNTGAGTPVVFGCDAQLPTPGLVELTPSSDDYIGEHFAVSTQFDDASGLSGCEVCVSTNGACVTEWTSEGVVLDGDTCRLADATCEHGQDVFVNVRARDTLRPDWRPAAAVQRTCDALGPEVVYLDTSGGAESVPETFQVFALLDDTGGAAAEGCSICVSTTGACADGDFVPATLVDGQYTVPGSCTSGDTVTLQARAVDIVGNVTTTDPIVRACDADSNPPVIGEVAALAPATDTHVNPFFGVQASVDDAVVCQVCASVDGDCDNEWTSVNTSIENGVCTAVNIPCADGYTMTIKIRGFDAVGNYDDSDATIRICDGIGPIAGVLVAANSVDDGFASSPFSLSTTFVDGNAGMQSCDWCATSDGACDSEDEWAAGTLQAGVCSAQVPCTDGASLTLAMRGTDRAGNTTRTGPVNPVVCDEVGPSLSALSIDGDGSLVGSPFTVTAQVADSGAGAEGCELCVSVGDDDCTGEWQAASLQGATCRATNLTCVDGAVLNVKVRATDGVGNPTADVAVPMLTRVCDASAPAVGGLVIDGGGSSTTHVDAAGFSLSMLVDDSQDDAVTCEVCLSTDGLCDDDTLEWTDANVVGGRCEASRTCADALGAPLPEGQALTLALRVTDSTGHRSSSASVVRTCDGGGPSPSGPLAFPTGAADEGGAIFVDAAGFTMATPFSDVVAAVAGAGVASCEVCQSATAGACDPTLPAGSAPWEPGVWSSAAGQCVTPAARTCSDGGAVYLAMRAIDGTGQVDPTGVAVTATCDGAAPTVLASTDALQVGGSPWAVDTHVGRLFSLEGLFDDPGTAASGLESCEVCSTTDGGCDSAIDWVPALLDPDGTCHAPTLTCIDGQDLTLNVRVTDRLGHRTEATEIQRTCDNAGPSAGGTALTSGATVTYVRGTGAGFSVLTYFNDAGYGAGAVSCEVCITTDGLCDDEWAPATLAPGGACTFTQPSCTDLDELVIQMRSTDAIGNTGTAIPIGRTCDAVAPTTPVLAVDNPEHFELAFTWDASFDFSSGTRSYFLDFDTDGPGAPFAETQETPFAGMILATQSDGAGGAEPLDPCTPYYARVRVTDRVGNEAISNEVAISTRCGQTGTFQTGANLALVATGTDLVAADVNDDGILDLLASTSQSESGNTYDDVHIYLGNGANGRGDGTFAAAASLDIPGDDKGVTLLRAADLNHDGILDILAYEAPFTGKLHTFLGGGSDGVGNGTFSWASSTSTQASFVWDLILADVNDDGISDVLFADRNGPSYDASFGVHLGNGANGRGDGTFGPYAEYLVGAGSRIQIAVADFDGDDRLDVATVRGNGSDLDIYTGLGSDGRGNGTYNAGAAAYTSGADGSLSLLSADLNSDGIPDFVTSDLDVVLGQEDGGGGRYLLNVGSPGGSASNGLATADLDGDRVLDLIAASASGLSILLGDGVNGRGSGAFTLVDTPLSGTSASRPVVGDFNGDGMIDVAVLAGSTLRTFHNTGTIVIPDGTLLTGATTTAAGATERSGIGDLDDDGILDYMHSAANGGSLYLHMGNGTNGQADGTFTARTPLNASSNPQGYHVVDLDEDGADDIYITDARYYLSIQGSTIPDDFVIHWNTPDANHYGTAVFDRDVYQTHDQGHGGTAFGDFDDNGTLDFVTTDRRFIDPYNSSLRAPGQISVMLNDGDGDGRGGRTFTDGDRYAAVGDANTRDPLGIASADLNNDGVLDLVYADPGLGNVNVLLGDTDPGGTPTGGQGDGTFTAGSTFALADARYVRVADVDADAIPDLLVLTGDGVQVLIGGGSNGTGTATYTAGQALNAPISPYLFNVADLDGDRILDLVVADNSSDVMRVYFGDGSNGRGTGTFSPGPVVPNGGGRGMPQIGDFDSDGALDIIGGRPSNRFVLLHGGGTFVITP